MGTAIHAFSAAVTKQADARFGGMISLSGPSRSLLDTVIEQFQGRHKAIGGDLTAVDRQQAAIFAAMPVDAAKKVRAVIVNANHVFKEDPREPASLSP